MLLLINPFLPPHMPSHHVPASEYKSELYRYDIIVISYVLFVYHESGLLNGVTDQQQIAWGSHVSIIKWGSLMLAQ